MSRANDAGTLLIGLSSGTSMDGIDAVLVRGGAAPPDAGIELLEFTTTPYDEALAAALRDAVATASPAELALLDVVVGEAFARTALDLLERADVEASAVDAIGSHGQTIVHVPEPTAVAGAFARASLQIGDAAVIAERTGITTVAGFRARDLAAGGQGAPLAPWLDHRLYTDAERGRVALNVGGIANITGLPPGAEIGSVVAFDTGPGNVLLDAAARYREIEAGYDVDGGLAAAGSVADDLLEALLEHPYYARRAPKSADIGDFLNDETMALLRRADDLGDADLLATLTELTARTIADAVSRFVAPRQPVDEVLISGGGAHNLALRERLTTLLRPATLRDAGEIAGVPGDAKEAVLFALLAAEALAGRPGNVPAATGAAGRRVLGAVIPGV